MVEYSRYLFVIVFYLMYIDTYSQWNNVNSIGGNSTLTFNASKVLSNNTIILTGDDGADLFNRKGVIYKSIDNGNIFTLNNSFQNAFQLLSMHFIDNTNAYVFGQTQNFTGFISKTTNGGATWTDDSIIDAQQLKANSFVNSQIGYVADFKLGDLKLYKTTDAGNSWNMVCNKNYQNGPINVVQFLTENLGYLCTQTHTNSGRYARVMRTTDGGNTWTALKSSLNEDYTSIHFFDYYNGILLTYYGYIYKTSNAGLTWNLVRNSSSLKGCNEMKFINPLVGYVVGTDSIFKTINGGTTWTSVHSISTSALFGFTTIDVNSNGIGIAAGQLGSFHSYTSNYGGSSPNNTIATAYISGYDSVCIGQNGIIRFDFSGIPPWNVTYTNGTNTQSISNVMTTPYFISVPSSSTRQEYSINNFTSNGIASTNIFGKAIVAIINGQIVSSTISGTKTICSSDSALLTIKLKGNKPYTFTYTDGSTNTQLQILVTPFIQYMLNLLKQKHIEL